MSRPVEILRPRAVEGDSAPARPGEAPPWGWTSWACGDGFMHLVPSWDVRPHTRTYACPCRPVLDESALFVHNSFDGRERYEQGLALPN